jgi:UDP-glucose:(heptosyl)LPS alpha-1,3-glucosyltransferase
VRIALVAHHARATGGQDRYLLELARQLAPRHDVHLVVVRAEGLEGSGVTVHELGIADRPALTLAPRFERRARALVAAGGFDIVHAIGGAMPGASVITAQYCQAAWREARARFHVREGAWWQDVYQAVVNARAIAAERRAYAAPALRAIIAVSRGTAAELERWYGVAPGRVAVVHNGVDLATFERARHPAARQEVRAELGLVADAPLALLVGTYARKGLDTAITAVARTGASLHLMVAGAGDDARARRQADEAGVAGRLHLLGPRSDVARLFAAADLFILPTRYEPFGMVIAEAMASELPVVVSACAGAAERIVDGASGYIVAAPDDAEGFASPLRTLLQDPARRAAVGTAARAAAQELSWDRVAARTEAVYRQAVAG